MCQPQTPQLHNTNRTIIQLTIRMLKPKTKTFLTVINWWTKLRQVKISFEFPYQEHQLNQKKNNIDTINREFEIQNTF